jgi:hypothetical protein
VITLRLGTLVSGTGLKTVNAATATMVWSPSATVTDLFGRACSIAPTTETGAQDREF